MKKMKIKNFKFFQLFFQQAKFLNLQLSLTISLSTYVFLKKPLNILLSRAIYNFNLTWQPRRSSKNEITPNKKLSIECFA